jgi:hypothetical protein
MGPNLAKRNSLSIDKDSSPAKKITPQFNHVMRKKETLANDSKTGKEIDTLMLEKLTMKPIPLARLVRELSNELPYKSDKIISKIIALQGDKKILIREPVPYTRFLDYLLSPISIWFWELVVATLASIGLVFASSGLVLYLRYIFGSLLALFLPGYSLVSFIYPKKEDIDYLTRTSVSFVMSLAITTLVGLALNFTPFGITLTAVALSLSAVTIGLLFLTTHRRYSYYRLANVMTSE